MRARCSGLSKVCGKKGVVPSSKRRTHSVGSSLRRHVRIHRRFRTCPQQQLLQRRAALRRRSRRVAQKQKPLPMRHHRCGIKQHQQRAPFPLRSGLSRPLCRREEVSKARRRRHCRRHSKQRLDHEFCQIQVQGQFLVVG